MKVIIAYGGNVLLSMKHLLKFTTYFYVAILKKGVEWWIKGGLCP
jgi:hypothetical protein